MNYLLRTILLASLLFPSYSFAAQCVKGDLIEDPDPFIWTPVSEPEPHFVGTMEIAEADLVINGETITTRVYRQEGGCNSIPGPTVTMVPGNKYVMKFRNLLTYEPASEEHNVFRDPNVSNLHTHGLHISGESPGDDVTRSFEGQTGGDFVYDIPDNHMGGTFWYHAHHHGSTYLQVSAGAFGLIVIDDQGDKMVIGDQVEPIPQRVADMEERQLVVAYLDPAVKGTGGDTLISGSLSPTWTVNGQVNGAMEVPYGTWHHWRVLLADRDAKEKTFSVGTGCEIALMARDGVWRTEVPKLLPTNSISLTGASRADLAVNCTANSNISVGGLQVASINVDQGNADSGPSPFNAEDTTWFSERPNYLQDLRNRTPDHQDTINMGARTVAGSKWDHAVPNFTLETNGVQEFKLKGATNHPFHLHIYHVQVQGDCGDFEDGEYYDVVAGNCTIRFDLTPETAYWGRTIMHCHILEHEDQGAMGWAQVLGGKPKPVFPDGDGDPTNGPYFEYIPAVIGPGDPPAAPGGLVVTEVSSSSIDLSWNDNSDNESSFKIERSSNTNPLAYAPIDTVDAEVTAYSDLGLDPLSTYWYRVIAFNNDGDSDPSNEASATTLEAGVPTALLLGSLTVSTVSEGKGQKRQRAVVAVTDNNGDPVAGAVVTGNFSGSISQTAATASTDAGGIAIIDTADTAKGGVSFEFCVTSIVDPNPDPLDPFNSETCANF